MYTIETIEKQYFLFFIFFFNFSHLSLIDLVNLLQLTLLTYLSFRLTQLTTYNIFYTHPRFLNLSDGSSDHGQRLTLFSFVCALNSCILFYRSPPAEPSPSPSPSYKSSRSFLPPPPDRPPPTPTPEFSLFSRFSQFTLLSLARRGDHQTADNNIQKEGNTVLHGVKNDSKVWSPCSWWTRWLRQTLRSRRTSPCTEGLKRTRWDYVVGASL